MKELRTMNFRAVVLGAGEAKRMGAQKLLMPFRGRPMIDHALEAAMRWRPVLVAGADVAAYVGERAGVELVLNEHPERGMAHSLALANAAIPSEDALAVLLADKPLVSAELVETICHALGDADVAFPVHPVTHEPGHPVVFSPRARAKIPLLPDGDSLRVLRDDPQFERRAVETEDPGAYFDVDTAAELNE